MLEPDTVEGMLFEVLTPLGFWVHVTRRYWQLIVNVKHPVMQGQAEKVKQTLRHSNGLCA